MISKLASRTTPTLLHERQQITTTTTTPTTASSTNSNSNSPSSSSFNQFTELFPDPTSTITITTPSTPLPAKRGVSQTVLMWIFAVIAIGLLSSIVIWRYTCVKLQQRRRRIPHGPLSPQSASSGFTGWSVRGSSPGSGPEEPPSAIVRDSDLDTSPSPSPWGNQYGRSRPITLSTSFLHSGLVPLVNRDGVLLTESRRPQRVRALDVDEGGRRGGGADSVLGSYALEELPAYEAGKSPPNYHAVAFTPNPANPSPPAIPHASRPGATATATAENTENGNRRHSSRPSTSSSNEGLPN